MIRGEMAAPVRITAVGAWLLVCAPGLAAPVQFKCPPGHLLAFEGDSAVCRPAPRAPTVIVLPPAAQAPAAPPPAAATVPAPAEPPAGQELSGMHGIPEICGLTAVDEGSRERAAEVVHMLVEDCMAEVSESPPTAPPRWLVVRVEALSETTHQFSPPPESWAEPLGSCFRRKKPRLPKTLRGRSFSAWFAVAPPGQGGALVPACGGAR